MKLRNWQLPLAIVLFMTGILLVSALNALQSEAEPEPRTKSKAESLIAMIETQEKELKDYEKTIDARRDSLAKHQKDIATGKIEVQTLQYELDQLKTLSGVSDVEGKGITVFLDDNNKGYEIAKSKAPEQAKPEDFLIHDKHLLYIVYELRVGGAEAISINGQRVVCSSDIRCMGTTIGVNTSAIGPPFVIKAIGDPDRMSKVLETDTSQYNILKMAGYPVRIEKQKKITIGSYKGSYQFSYTEPKGEQ
ncbi:MAG TPA: DUF881 domain-containing protein [Syntrophomonadaceae bacterium]|nr:DUF881 domain-containing protein [Syntrophomonadaceae bacterium]